MECLLAIACLFNSSNLYVSGDLYTQVSNRDYGRRWCFNRPCYGTLAELRIGMKVDITPSMQIDYGLRHTSFPDENDRGEESAFLGFTYRPFAR